MAEEKNKMNRLTPMDIQKQQFKKSVLNGYNRQDVNQFIDRIVNDYGDALDETIDLKNKLVQLQEQVNDLQAQVKRYQQIEVTVDQTIASAQEQGQQIISQASAQAAKVTQQAQVDTDYQRQQLETLTADYDRLKQEVAGYRNYLQALFQKAIANLNDEEWQKVLDRYFGTERFYPPDGSEPITLSDEDDEEIEDDDEVDNDDADEVNLEDEDDGDPQPLSGDSLNTATSRTSVKVTTNSEERPNVIFPDNYKDHN